MRRETVKPFKSKTPEEALSSLMRLCARAEKSSGDAMRLMSRWGVIPERRAEVLERLIADKFIDDRRFAEAFVREKMNLSGWGSRKIASSLKIKGIAQPIIAEMLSALDPDTLSQRLSSMIQRKARSVKYKDKFDLQSKLIRYGLSLGYQYDMVLDAVSQQIKINLDDE